MSNGRRASVPGSFWLAGLEDFLDRSWTGPAASGANPGVLSGLCGLGDCWFLSSSSCSRAVAAGRRSARRTTPLRPITCASATRTAFACLPSTQVMEAWRSIVSRSAGRPSSCCLRRAMSSDHGPARVVGSSPLTGPEQRRSRPGPTVVWSQPIQTCCSRSTTAEQEGSKGRLEDDRSRPARRTNARDAGAIEGAN